MLECPLVRVAGGGADHHRGLAGGLYHRAAPRLARPADPRGVQPSLASDRRDGGGLTPEVDQETGADQVERDAYKNRAKELGAHFTLHYMDVPYPELYRRLEICNRTSAEAVFVIPKTEMDKYIPLFQPP